MVGIPAISASVGCVTDLIRQGENGYLYRYDEHQTLAYYIDKLFCDDSLACRIGDTGKRVVAQKYPQDKIGDMLMSAYLQMQKPSME